MPSGPDERILWPWRPQRGLEEALMKRLVMASVVLTGLAVGAQAGELPKPIALVDRVKIADITHYVRGAKAGKRGGGSESSTAEARQAAPSPSPTEKQKPEPKPAKAD